MKRFLQRSVLFGTGLLLVTFLAVWGWARYWPVDDMTQTRSDGIVCLAAGLTKDGRMGAYTRARAQTCVALYHAQVAPMMVFTGGNTRGNSSSTGALMARYALASGVPRSAIRIETRSLSTLQNALFSMPFLAEARHIHVVTDSFHLPRAWASFVWAGANHVTLVPSRRPDGRLSQPSMRILARETLAIWFNLARATGFSLVQSLGWVDDAPIRLLD